MTKKEERARAARLHGRVAISDPALQFALDCRCAANLTAAAKSLGITEHQANSLMYGGKALPAVVARVEAKLREQLSQKGNAHVGQR